MTFSETEAFAVDEALCDLGEARVSAGLYAEAERAVTTYADGSFTIDRKTLGGAKLLVRVCEILVARPEYA